MVDNYVIRKAKIDDVSIIEKIENDCQYDIYSPNLIRSAIEDEYTVNFIIFDNDIPVGYISAQILFEECELFKIIVKKSYRRLGIAVILIDYLKEYLNKNNINKIFLEVRKDNLPAIKLYEKCNFKLINIRRGYYNGVDALIYIFNND